MSNKTDYKIALSKALSSLLKEKPFEEITIQNILEKSLVSRSTFYRHFNDKYSLMNWVYMTEVDDILSKNPNPCNSKDIIIESANFIKRNEDYFRRVIKYKGQNSFLEFLAEYAKKTTSERISKAIEKSNLPLEILYSIEFYCGGLIFVITNWIESGLKESPEKIAELVYDCIPDAIKKYME